MRPVTGRARLSIRLSMLFLLANAAPSCVSLGDFGRPVDSQLFGSATEWVEMRDALPAGVESPFTFTNDEQAMRERSYRLRTPIGDPAPVPNNGHSIDNYADRLTAQNFPYGPSRIYAIVAELEADHVTLTAFAESARLVVRADQGRLHDLGSAGPYSGDVRKATHIRVRENGAFMKGTFADMRHRLSAYLYALERSRLEAPGADQAFARRLLFGLRERAVCLEYELLGPLGGVAVEGGSLKDGWVGPDLKGGAIGVGEIACPGLGEDTEPEPADWTASGDPVPADIVVDPKSPMSLTAPALRAK